MTWKPKLPGWWAGAICGLLWVQSASSQTLDDLYEVGEQRIQQAQAQQEEIDAIVDVTEDRFEAYQVLLREIEDLEIYNNLLEAQVNAQRRELNNLYSAIDRVYIVERQILPLMRRMINGLERFIRLDVPFLLEDRLERVERLRALLLRSDVTVAEQFRLVLEAFLIEMDDYGRLGDTYTDVITTANGSTLEVEILRIGRVALLYVTPDGSQAGAWDNNARQWVTLDPSMAQEIRIGIDAYETEQPALFIAPVPPPEGN